MTDSRLRAAERRVAVGDLEARGVLLRERLRVGTLTHGRLALAAHCGDGLSQAVLGYPPWPGPKKPAGRYEDRCRSCDDLGARVVMVDGAAALDPCPCTDPHHWRFADWLHGLSRFADLGPVPGWILVRAACAAARVAHDSSVPLGLSRQGGRQEWWDALRAIEAAEAWVICPCLPHARACVVVLCGLPWLYLTSMIGIAQQGRDIRPGRPGGRPIDFSSLMEQCAFMSGEAPIRASIQSSLISWALS